MVETETEGREDHPAGLSCGTPHVPLFPAFPAPPTWTRPSHLCWRGRRRVHCRKGAPSQRARLHPYLCPSPASPSLTRTRARPPRAGSTFTPTVTIWHHTSSSKTGSFFLQSRLVRSDHIPRNLSHALVSHGTRSGEHYFLFRVLTQSSRLSIANLKILTYLRLVVRRKMCAAFWGTCMAKIRR